MKKVMAVSILIMALNSCASKAPLLNTMMLPQNTMISSVNNNDDIVKIVDRHTTVLNKQKVIQRLISNKIKLEKADIFDKTNVFRIEFSQGRVGVVPGFLRMYLRPSGISEIQLVGNFFRNTPVQLTPSETAKILKSATNYQEHSANLDRILGY